MSILDVQPPQKTAADGAFQCRRYLRMSIDTCENTCRIIRHIVSVHGLQNVADELGDDATAMQTLYLELKALAETYGRVVPSINS